MVKWLWWRCDDMHEASAAAGYDSLCNPLKYYSLYLAFPLYFRLKSFSTQFSIYRYSYISEFYTFSVSTKYVHLPTQTVLALFVQRQSRVEAQLPPARARVETRSTAVTLIV